MSIHDDHAKHAPDGDGDLGLTEADIAELNLRVADAVSSALGGVLVWAKYSPEEATFLVSLVRGEGLGGVH